jgi:mono/diheme cytochrome c family protein
MHDMIGHEAIGPMALIAVAGLLVWTTIGALRIRNRFAKWAAAGLSALLALAVCLASALAVTGLVKLQSRSASAPVLTVAGTADQVRRGQAIADSFCGICHDSQLTGGLDLGQHLPIPVGIFRSANLTPAGRLSHWSDGEIFRAIRNSVDADGRWMMIMSYTNAARLSDEDVRALIAYLRSRPPAGPQSTDPPDRLNLFGTIMLGAGLMPTPRPTSTDVVTAPPKGPTAQYGEYLLSYQDCRLCHGADLSGGLQGQFGPVGPGLTLVKEWKREQFVATLRTGIDPGGHQLAKEMPWQPIGKMDDEDLAAIYEYLIRLPDVDGVTAH